MVRLNFEDYRIRDLFKRRDSWEKGLTTHKITEILYGHNNFEMRAKARNQIHSSRRKWTSWLRQVSGLKDIMYPLFSSKPKGLSPSKKRRYFLHGTTEDLNRIYDFMDSIKTGTKNSMKSIKA